MFKKTVKKKANKLEVFTEQQFLTKIIVGFEF